jgi:hypothetical protein
VNAHESARPEAAPIPQGCWTDASGNYLGEGPEVAVEAYIGVESTAGRLLCPGCGGAMHRRWTVDPVRLAGLIYFGTSDENLYLKCDNESQAADASIGG